MDIQAFVLTLDRYTRDGLLVLPAQNDLASGALTSLIEDLWQGRPLTLRLDSREVQGQSLRVRGALPRDTSPLLPEEDLAVSGAFYLLDGQAQLTLSVPLPDGYRLSDSFEALRPTSAQRAVFEGASFVIDSAGAGGSSGTPAADRRWLFRGDLRIAGEPLFLSVKWLLGEPERIAMAGAVRFGAAPGGRTVPLLELTGAVRQPFELGPFQAQSAVLITAAIVQGGGGSERYAAAVEVLNRIRAGGIELPLALRLGPGEPPLQVLSLRGEAPRLSGVSQLSTIVDGPDYAGLLPPQVPLGAGLRLTRLDLTVAPATRRLVSLEIGLALDTGLEIIPGALELEQVGVSFQFLNLPSLSLPAVRIAAVLDIAGVGLEAALTMPGPVFEAQLAPGQRISITGLLRHFFGEGSLPEDVELDVVELGVTAEPRAQAYRLEAVLDGEIPLGFGLFDLTLDGLVLNVESAPGGLSGVLSCFFTLLGTAFEAAAEKPGPGQAWIFSASLLPGATISLSSAAETLLGLPADALPEIALEGVGFRIDSGSKAYALTARTAGFWEFPVTDDYLLRLAVDVRIERDAARKLSGELTGELLVNDFRVLTTYSFDPGVRRLKLEIQYQDLRLAAEISSEAKPAGGGRRTILKVDLGTLDLGAALRYLADVAAPGLDITLDEPWDLLMNLRLTNMVLVIDLTDKTVGFETRVNRNFGFVSVDTVGLLYGKKAGKPSLDLRITGRFLGTSYPADKPLSWNVLDGRAPDVPGRGSGLLDVRYLGLGQRVALRSTAGIDTVAQAIDRLRAAIGPVDDSKPPLAQLDLVRFDRDSHWLIGLEIVALDTVQLAIVFNDPYLHGLLLRLQGPRAGALAGLAFEILYKKITDDIGMFKAEVQLPDAFRRIEVGAATLVLPVVALEIYTNGDFKVDLGFPRNRDFTRSFSLQIGPFMGYGGLYFAKLTGATSRRVPVITNGEFHPVLEFGLGLSVGLGKEIRKGPLKAGLSIAIEAILEGALTWFHPYDAAVRSDRYYWIQGTLALVGRLYGEVDFRILSVSIEVVAYASASFTIESYEPIRIVLSVGVSVSASIKILFVRIRFSFRITLTESFTIGSKGTPPWIVAPPQSPALPRVAARKAFAAAALAMEAADAPPGFDWTAGAVFAEPRTVELTALPAFTVAAESPQGVLLLTVASGEGGKPADTLVELLLSWAIQARLGRLDGEVTAAEIDEVHDALQDAGMLDSAFRYENLSELLGRNLRVRIRGNADAPHAGDSAGDVAVLPMIPELSYRVGDGEALSFRDHNPVDDDYSRRVAEYFRQLSVAFGQEQAAAESRDALAASTVSTVRSAATVIFCDALLMLARTAAQAARDLLAALPGVERIGVSQLLAELVATGRSANAGAMLSRFLLHGLRLPSPADAGFLTATAAEIRAAGRTETALEPLYELTGQQFPVPAGDLEITVEKSAEADWIELVGEAKDGKDAGGTDGGEAVPVPAGLVIRLTAAEVAAESPEAEFAIPFRGPEPLPLAQTVPVRSTLSRYLRWGGTGLPALPAGGTPAQAALWLFPQDLLARVEAGATAGLPYELAAGHDTGGPVPRVEPVRSYAWATALEVQVRRAVTPGGAFLPDTYLVLGANQTGRELLRGLWSHLDARPGEEDGTALHLLHRSPDGTEGALTSDAVDLGGTFLLQTNLSTLTTSGVEFAFAARATMRKAAAPASGTYWASLGAPKAFLKRLWEGSVTGTGGYYLRYRTADGTGLPDTLFSDRGDATLWLVVLLESQTAEPPARTLAAFHNAAVVGDTLDPAAVNVFAQAAEGRGEQTRIASVPPGHTGFRLVRPSAELGDGAPDAAERAASLFSLLGYHLREAGPFLSSNEGLPVGPQPPDGADPDDPAADWIYDRVVPVARFARLHPLPDSPFLPAPEGDPYAGLQRGAEATVAFAFRDVFGNPAGAASAIPDLPLPVGYTDDLIGVSAWPGVSGAYEVLPGDRPVLAVGFDFETAGYLPGAGTDPAVALATAAAHAGRYRQIYYQVQQQDVAFRLRSSITPDASYEADKAGLAGLVQGAWVFLNGAGSLRAVAHAVAEGETLEGVAVAYSVTTAALGQAVSAVPAATLFRDAVRVPVYHRVSFGDTLESVAAETGLTLEDLLRRNPGAADPLSPGAPLLVDERALVAGPADTLAGIAADAGVTVEQLAGFNRATALQPGSSLPIPGLVELAAGADGEAGGMGLTMPSQVRPGESLGAVAARLGLDLLDFARLHAALDLLAPGVEVRVDGLSATTRPGDSLNALAGRLGASLEALAPAVAGSAGLPRPGAFVAGPAPVAGDPETLAELSARTGVSAGALARANAAVDGLLRPGATVTVRGRTLTVGAHETWNSLVERFRASEPSVETSIEELAGNADVRTSRGLLRPGARLLVPPAPVHFGVPLDGTRNPAAIFEVAVDLEMARDAALVHPDFAGTGKVALQSTPLAPRATPGAGSADGALALQDLARRFQAALPELRLATGGRRTVGEDPRASRPLWAVRFARSGHDGAAEAFSGFSLDGSRPVFYALRPLSNRPVSRGGVPVRPYRSGEGLADPAPVNLQGVDLDVWARDFLAAMDLFLSPESAVAAFRSAPDAFEAVTGAKKTLAEAIRLGVEPLLDSTGDGDGLEAAREAVRQRLLIELGPAYATDTLLQFRTSVASPFTDAMSATAPRLSGRPVSRVYRAGETEGLATVAAAFGVSPSHLARVLAPVTKVLRAGLTVELAGSSATVQAGDSLASLAARLGVEAAALAGIAGLPEDAAGRLFAPGAVLPLTGLRRAAGPLDTFDSLADAFEISTATLAEAVQDVPGIFRAGAVLPLPGRPAVTVADGDATLRQVAAGAGLSPADLAEGVIAVPGLFGPAFAARAVALVPEHTLSSAKTPLIDGGSAVTFLLDVRAEAERRKVFLDLDYAVNELEHDVEAVAGVEGYQASSWLSFLLPLGAGGSGLLSTTLGLTEVPLPLRSAPLPPALPGQEEGPTVAAPASLAEARQWTYGFRFQHQDAAQDSTFLRIVLNEDGGAGSAGAGGPGAEGGALLGALAEFSSSWAALERDLARLREPGGESDETARTAARTFAELARNVAAAWTEHWAPPRARFLKASRSVRQVYEYRITRTVRPGSEPPELETLVLAALSDPGPGGRFPGVSWVDAQGQAHPLARESETAAECVYRYPEGVPAFTRQEHLCTVPGLDVVTIQNATAGLQVTRNAELVSAGPTREPFVYRTPFIAFSSPVLPLLSQDAVVSLRQGGEALEASLERFFAELAGPDGRPLPLVLRVAARYGYELVPGVGGEPIVSLLPILLRPRFVYREGFAAELAAAVQSWEAVNQPNRQGGFYLFDVGVFSSLDESLPWPILDLTGLAWRLDPVAEPALAGVPQKRNAPRA